MSRTTFCDPPDGWKNRLKNLREQGLSPAAARILLEVELCFHLVQFLGCDEETVGVVPALLSGLPLHGVCWTPAQTHASANVRQIAPFGSTSAWRAALETYAALPGEWRHYRFPDRPVPDLDEGTNEAIAQPHTGRTEWMVCLLPKPEAEQKHKQHTELYRRAVSEILPPHTRKSETAKPGTTYQFTAADAQNGTKTHTVSFPKNLPMIQATSLFPPGATRPRAPLTVHLRHDLEPVARELDEADAKAGRGGKNWCQRLAQIRYRRVTPPGEPDETAPDEIPLNGFHHAAGMVASGKTTFSFLLAAWVISRRPDLRLTFVVGDVQSSLRIADELNTYFCTNVETDAPVAVSLLGRRSRDKHLRDLSGSRDYGERRAQNAAHWGERFLSTVCPLQSLVPVLSETPLPPGQEPCANLRPLFTRRRGQADDTETANEKRLLCPLYARCPVHQLVHDMPNARVWITTPWAMAYGSLPRQVENRPVHFGEIIYEQSDIVVFDEADAMMGVFDEVFAEVAELSNGKNGIYDRLGAQTERFAISRRSDAGAHRMRWSNAQRSGQNATMMLLALLSEPETAYLRRWLQRTQFTPHLLMVRLTRLICGLIDFPRSGEEDSQSDRNRFNDAFEPFRLLFGVESDPVRQKHLSPTPEGEGGKRSPADKAKNDAYFLWRILLDITNGANLFGDDLLRSCRDWLQEAYPDIEKNLAASNDRRKAAQKNGAKGDFENLDRTAHRLLLTLASALLDSNTNTVLYEWHSRAAPDEEDVEPHRRMPAVLRDILPLPPIGRQFGTYFAPGDDTKRNTNRLSYLSYTNVGRWYLLHFHRLRTDLDGLPGPHVLALSGTSYLPGSVRLHVGTQNSRPHGLLLPEDRAMKAIQSSTFRYLPLAAPDRKPLRVSGTPEWEKRGVLVSLAHALVQPGANKLAAELADLTGLGFTDPAQWADRARLLLLVNSYEQAKIVGDALRQTWQADAGRIYHLARTPKNGEGDELAGGTMYRPAESDDADVRLQRTDIETFAQTGGHVLVAPISAIGRGFNILNRQNPPLAAFGSVYFLVRPYPHPDDMTALARELNRRTMDWAEWADFGPWNQPGIEQKFRALRRAAGEYWHDMERRKYWSTLHDRPAWQSDPRKDLAAYTSGIIVQAVGRLLRGGVPFHGFFCDAAFAMKTAQWYCAGANDEDAPPDPDAPVNSLLAAVLDWLRDQVATDPIAAALYAPLADALCDMRVGIAPNDYPFEPLAHWQKLEKKS